MRPPFDLVLEAPEDRDSRSIGSSPAYEGQEHPTEKGWFWTGRWDRLGFPLYIQGEDPVLLRRARLEKVFRAAMLWMVTSPMVFMVVLFVFNLVRLERGVPRR